MKTDSDTPRILYHASSDQALAVLLPSDAGKRYASEPPAIFATPNKGIAAMFLAPKDAGPAEICVFGDELIVAVQTDPETFLAKDTGGAIYQLPSDTFATESSVGMGLMEYVSTVPVEPVSKEIFKTSIEAMQATGVKLYFVDELAMTTIRTAEDHGLALFRGREFYHY